MSKELFFCNFEKALSAMREGRRVARMAWNYTTVSRNMTFVSLCHGMANLPADKFWNPHNRKFAETTGSANVDPYFSYVSAATGCVSMGWCPTTGDILAEDWVVLAD